MPDSEEHLGSPSQRHHNDYASQVLREAHALEEVYKKALYPRNNPPNPDPAAINPLSHPMPKQARTNLNLQIPPKTI